MAQYRLTHAAKTDIASILTWSQEHFGDDSRNRYAALIAAAIRDAATRTDDLGHRPRPELGEGVFTWHLSQSRQRTPTSGVRHTRHFLVCRPGADTLIVGRVLHDSMDLPHHGQEQRWH